MHIFFAEKLAAHCREMISLEHTATVALALFAMLTDVIIEVRLTSVSKVCRLPVDNTTAVLDKMP